MSKLRTKYKRLKAEHETMLHEFKPHKIVTVPVTVKPYKAKARIPNSLFICNRGSLLQKEELARRELVGLIAKGIKDQLVINKGEDDGVYTTYTTIIYIGFEEGE